MGININDLPPWVQKQVMDKLNAQNREKAVREAEEKKKRNKYNNTPTERKAEEGAKIKFPSLKEANRYEELMLLLKAGKISDLRLQHEFTLIEGYTAPDGKRVRAERYKADFTYWQDGEFIVEDTKGGRATQTETYKIKRKQMRDKFGIVIREI